MESNLLFENKLFRVEERNGYTGMVPLFTNVVIMPFISDEQGLPLSIGVLKEPNPFRDGGMSISLITGTTEEEDPDLLSTAKRELKEESGYDVQDNKRWFYLGSVTASKFVDHEQPCFAVDVTDVVKGEPNPDNNEKENLIEFKFISANDVVKHKDIFIPGLFLKLFKFVLGFDVQNKQEGLEKSKGFKFSI
jgi:8-oxo-dGTP pyrophosphatase MutT (NUDIX family)